MSDHNEVPTKKNNSILWIVLGCGCGCGLSALIAVGILIAMMFPAIQVMEEAAREATRRMTCINHVKQISLAMLNYHDVYNSLPPAYTTDEDGNPLHSWRVLLLPFLEQKMMYDQIRLDEPWDSEHNQRFHLAMPPTYICPSADPDDGAKGRTSYQWVVGPNTISDGPGMIALNDVVVGLSNTVYLVEVIPTTCWMAPIDVQESELTGSFSQVSGVGSLHPGGINIGILDASVRFMTDAEAPQLKELVKIKR